MNTQTAKLLVAMTEYDHSDPMRIQHFIKVHSLAASIGRLEQLDPHTLLILETAALVHDIGIHKSEEKYGSSAGKYQEKEGPDEARTLLARLGGYEQDVIDRVAYLVAHHHTYTNIDGLDYQILVEADFLVNIYEDHLPQEAIINVRDRIFKTATGKHLLEQTFLV